MRTITWCRIKISAIIKIAHADIVLEIGRHCLEAISAICPPFHHPQSGGSKSSAAFSPMTSLFFCDDPTDPTNYARWVRVSSARARGIEFGTISSKRFAHKMRQVLDCIAILSSSWQPIQTMIHSRTINKAQGSCMAHILDGNPGIYSRRISVILHGRSSQEISVNIVRSFKIILLLT